MGKSQRFFKKGKTLRIYDRKKKKWKDVSSKNPNYKWGYGEFTRKPSM